MGSEMTTQANEETNVRDEVTWHMTTIVIVMDKLSEISCLSTNSRNTQNFFAE